MVINFTAKKNSQRNITWYIFFGPKEMNRKKYHSIWRGSHDLPIIRNGAAKLIPINSTPKYIARPKAAEVAMTALTFPSRPNHGFDLTVSPIMHVSTLWKRNKFFTFLICRKKIKSEMKEEMRKQQQQQHQHIPKYGHQNESGTKIGNDGSRILFQFMIKCSWCKSSDSNMFKISRLFILADCVQKFIFPCGTSVK